MNDKVSSLSSFIEKLDTEILNEDQAILLKGGFAPASTEEEGSNLLCNTDNCDCTVPTDDCKAQS